MDRAPEVASYSTEALKRENMKDSGPPCPAGSEVKSRVISEWEGHMINTQGWEDE